MFSRFSAILFLSICLLASACDPGQPSDGFTSGFNVSGYAQPLSTSDYQQLSSIQQYQVTNKLLATLYRGVAIDEFFDLSKGVTATEISSVNTMTVPDIRQDIEVPLTATEREFYDELIIGDQFSGGKYEFTFQTKDKEQYKELPLVRIIETPISRDHFNYWVAYVLMNSILFSPAEELSTVDNDDVLNLFTRLFGQLNKNTSIRDIVLAHQFSVENWRRFRSPEDNTREMMEIYLGLFDIDDDVTNAATACQDLFLEDTGGIYALRRTPFVNTDPVAVLGQFVIDCDDVYSLIASHPLLIPRVTTVLVEYFFNGRSSEDRSRIVESIVNSNPQTFQDIFSGIIFSREYLLNTERPAAFEETFFNQLARIHWQPGTDTTIPGNGRQLIRLLVTGNNTLTPWLEQSNWATMEYKLGRLAGVPFDTLSFSWYHKNLRERLFLVENNWRPGYFDGVAEVQAITDPAQLIDYAFISVLGRHASASEINNLIAVMDTAIPGNLILADGTLSGTPINVVRFIEIVFDYFTRLPEMYHMQKIN